MYKISILSNMVTLECNFLYWYENVGNVLVHGANIRLP